MGNLPALNEQLLRNWLAQVEGLEVEALVEALVLSKFRVVWVERFGYSDNGEHMISSLIEAGASDMPPGADPRFVALDLEPVAIQLRQRSAQASLHNAK